MKEQAKSLGAEFLTVDIKEEGDKGGWDVLMIYIGPQCKGRAYGLANPDAAGIKEHGDMCGCVG